MRKTNILIASIAVVTGLLIGCSQQHDNEMQRTHTPVEGITIIERVSEEGSGVRVVLSGEEAYNRFMNDSTKLADTLSLTSFDERDPLKLIREEFRVIEATKEANESSLRLSSDDCDGDFTVDAFTDVNTFFGAQEAEAEAFAVGCGDSENGVSTRAGGDERSERDRDSSTGDDEASAQAEGRGADCFAIAAASVSPGDSVGDYSDC